MGRRFRRQAGLILESPLPTEQEKQKRLFRAVRQAGFSVLLAEDSEDGAAAFGAAAKLLARMGALRSFEEQRISLLRPDELLPILRKGFLRQREQLKKPVAAFWEKQPWQRIFAETQASWQLQQQMPTAAKAVSPAQLAEETEFWLFLLWQQQKLAESRKAIARRMGLSLASRLTLPRALLALPAKGVSPLYPPLGAPLWRAAAGNSLLLLFPDTGRYTIHAPRSLEQLRQSREGHRRAKKLLRGCKTAGLGDGRSPVLLSPAALTKPLQLGEPAGFRCRENAVLLPGDAPSFSDWLGRLSPQQFAAAAARLELAPGQPPLPCLLDALLRSDARLVLLGCGDLAALLDGQPPEQGSKPPFPPEKLRKRLDYYGRAL